MKLCFVRVSRKKYGWRTCNRGYTLIELIGSIAIWSIVVVVSTSLVVSVYKHKIDIDKVSEFECKQSDVGIDIRHRLLSDSVTKYEVKEDMIISHLKKTTSHERKKVILVINRNLVENHYYKSGDAYYLLEEVIISRGIENIKFIHKENLIYVKILIEGEEEIICI